MHSYEITTEPISASALGRPVVVVSTTDVSATPLHTITAADAIDSVWLTATNETAARVTLHVVINPVNGTVAGNVSSARVSFEIPALGTVVVLDGARVRKGTATYTIAAYASAANAIKVLGYAVRKTYSPVVS